MTIADIYNGAERFINEILRKEIVAQGHHLTGALESSLEAEIKRIGKSDAMQGFAVEYAKYINDGVRPEAASMKQFPFLVEFFNQKGYPEYSSSSSTLTSRALAAMTIKKWMKEGMSTQASKRFSSTGSRQNFVENAFIGNESKIDEYMGNSFDFVINEEYKKEKSEVI
ncbi:hypothetical protein ACLOAU_14630 [Niabella sp. CJ426]|uniref:hypothetical protein n=1 Tax=Niabella sp. CJ426 TaxID=3393740 RepID=UPI003D0620AB